MADPGEILALIACVLMVVAITLAPRRPSDERPVVRRQRQQLRKWAAAGSVAMALSAILWAALVTVSAENFFDPGHRLDAAQLSVSDSVGVVPVAGQVRLGQARHPRGG